MYNKVFGRLEQRSLGRIFVFVPWSWLAGLVFFLIFNNKLASTPAWLRRVQPGFTMRFKVTTLGCKVNQYESAALAGALKQAGLEPALADADKDDHSDLLVINTCCVTTTAMRKSRQAIRKSIRNSPGAAVLVMGCYSDHDESAIRGLLDQLGLPKERTFLAGHQNDLSKVLRKLVDSLVTSTNRLANQSDCTTEAPSVGGNVNLPGTVRLGPVEKLPAHGSSGQDCVDLPGTAGLGPIEKFPAHSRAFVKVQDGCDAYCTYCIIPHIRKSIWSRPVEQIFQECRNLVRAGHKEIVLCGVFLGAFGRKTAIRRTWPQGPDPLGELVRQVAGIEGLWRLRLSSLEPGDITDNLIEICSELDNFAPHFHLPLQSGSNRILKRMNRQYDVAQFQHAVEKIKHAFDRPAITADVIVGYPSQSEEDFAQTLALAREVGFAKMHIFPFSPIEGTAAWRYRNEMPDAQLVKSRARELSLLGKDLARRYRAQFIGEATEALVEAGPEGRQSRAMTDRYQRVFFSAKKDCPVPGPGEIVNLKIDDLADDGLIGSLL